MRGVDDVRVDMVLGLQIIAQKTDPTNIGRLFVGG
jgi:hypothetical protein